MVAIARVMAVLATLAGCGLPPPSNATPCETEGHASQACQIWMYDHVR
jgi:predicted small lipoprotein YifL